MHNQYQYQPLVRTPEEDEENQFYNPPYTKVKLGLKYNTTYPDFLVFKKDRWHPKNGPVRYLR